MTHYTADYCDNFPEQTSVLEPGFNHFGGKHTCQGQVITIQLDRNNSDLISLLRDGDGRGKVVVVDARQAYYAVVGENLMNFALNSEFEGIIVNGYIRDTLQIKDIPVALYALGSCPRKYIPVTEGQLNVPVSFGGVDFRPGDYLYLDTDGAVVSENALPTI